MNYSTYDKEFFAIIRTWEHWSHCLLPREFILHKYHHVLKYIIAGQVQQMQCKVGVVSSVIHVHVETQIWRKDALSKKMELITMMESKLTWFQSWKELYATNDNFKEIYEECSTKALDIRVKASTVVNSVSVRRPPRPRVP